MGYKEKAIQGVRWTSFSTVILAITQLVTTAILARLLVKSDFGLMAIIMVVKGLAELFMDFGITVAILHKQNISKEEYSSLYWINMLIGFVIYGFLWIITPKISTFYNEIELLKLIPLMCLAIPLSSFGRMQKTVLQKELHFKTIAIVEITSTVFSLGVATYLALVNYGIYALIFSNLFRYVVANVVYFFIGINVVPIKLHFSLKEVKPFFKIGMYSTGGQLVNYFSTTFDVLIIGKILGADALGVYNLAKDLVLKPSSMLFPVISRVITPLFAKMQNDKENLQNYFFEVQNIIANINAFVYLGIALLSSPIINLYYGSGYEKCIPIVSILALYYMLREYAQPISMVCIAKGRTDIDLWWNLIIVCLLPIFVYIASCFSIVIVALVLLFFVILMFYPGWYMYARKLLDVSFFKYCNAIFGALKLFIIPCLLTIVFLVIVDLSYLLTFLVCGTIFAISSFVMFYYFNRNVLSLILQIVHK